MLSALARLLGYRIIAHDFFRVHWRRRNGHTMRWITVFHRVEVPPVWSTRKEGILIMARSGEGPRSGRPATGSSTALTTTRVEAPVYVNPATVIDASSTVSAGSEQLDQDKVL